MRCTFDVMDGHFVPNISFGFPVLKATRKATDAFLDVHLMISHPLDYAKRLLTPGQTRSPSTWKVRAT